MAKSKAKSSAASRNGPQVAIKLKVGLTTDDFGGVKDEVCKVAKPLADRLVKRGYADRTEAGADAVEPS